MKSKNGSINMRPTRILIPSRWQRSKDRTMAKIIIDGNEIDVPAEYTLLQACEEAGAEVPRFCYHERLTVAGNCRMCLVEVKGGPPKPTGGLGSGLGFGGAGGGAAALLGSDGALGATPASAPPAWRGPTSRPSWEIPL
jgi:hypothetical protein